LYIFKDILIHSDLWWNPCTICIFYFTHALNTMFFKLGPYCRWGLYLHVGLCVVQYLFDLMKDITIMPCGHTMHLEWLREMDKHTQCIILLTWKEGFKCHFSLKCCKNECASFFASWAVKIICLLENIRAFSKCVLFGF
jgi:hypothetical protein